MSFAKLMEDLQSMQSLQKALPNDGDEDDGKVAAAAADGEAAGAADVSGADAGAGSDAAVDGGEAGGDGDGDEVLGKSFEFKLENGDTIEAMDGTELIKSLHNRFDAQEESLTKALGVAVDLIKSQGEAIGTLQSEVKRLAGEGRGRKATVSVSEKPGTNTLAKSEPVGMGGEEFMGKALAAQEAGRITGLQVSIAEGSLLKGLPVPADIVKRVLG